MTTFLDFSVVDTYAASAPALAVLGPPEPAAQRVSQSLANALASKWKENRGKVRSWIHTRLAFCIIRGSSNCLRSQK